MGLETRTSQSIAGRVAVLEKAAGVRAEPLIYFVDLVASGAHDLGMTTYTHEGEVFRRSAGQTDAEFAETVSTSLQRKHPDRTTFQVIGRREEVRRAHH